MVVDENWQQIGSSEDSCKICPLAPEPIRSGLRWPGSA